MFSLPLIDIVVIALYFVLVLGIGVWCSRRVKEEEDYFLAGRRFGKLIQTFATFGQATSVDDAVAVSTTTFHNGASGIWSALLFLFATPAYWLTTPWYRRLRVMSLGDFFKERYGSRPMAGTYAIIGTIGMVAIIALGFNALSKTISATMPKTAAQFTDADWRAYEHALSAEEQLQGKSAAELGLLTPAELETRDRLAAMSPTELDPASQHELEILNARKQVKLISHIDGDTLVWVICIIVVLYAAFGGLEASFLTNTVQGMLIIVLSIIFLPFAWSKLNQIHGGEGIMSALGHVHRLLPDSYFEIFGSPSTVDFTWYYILVASIMVISNVAVQPNQLQAAGSARDEYAARYGFTLGAFLKRFCTVFWGLFGLTAIALYSQRVNNADFVWGFATRDLLGSLELGLVGLMIACLMAALMSTVDCLMITCASLLTHNIYREVIPGRTPAHYIRAGRLMGGGVVVGSAWVALQFDSIFQILKFIWEINVALAPAYWLGMKWRRANRAGAWASIGVGSVLFLILPLAVPMLVPSLRSSESLLATTQPVTVTRMYQASEYDVRLRAAEIAQWDAASAQGTAAGPRPQALDVGTSFEKVYAIPPKSIFWSQGIVANEVSGTLVGSGMLNLELIALDALGIDLTSNSYAQNETIRIAIRVALPFLLMILVSLLTRPDPREQLDRFYAKMRTPVHMDPREDAKAVAASQANVDMHRERLLFPHSQWELYRWTRLDTMGFAVACAGVAGILVMMTFLVSLGG